MSTVYKTLTMTRTLAQENAALKSKIGDLEFEKAISEMNKEDAIEDKEALEREAWDTKLQLDASERFYDEVTEEKEALESERDGLKEQLRASRKLNEDLRQENAVLEGKLRRALTEIVGQKRKLKNLDRGHWAEYKI
ncbi:MAG: hypothetical protein Q9208_002139 [Pyrenodesmia sp. 3 TL-2023]